MRRKVLKCRHLNLGFCEKLRTLRKNFSHRMKMSLIVVIEVNNFYMLRQVTSCATISLEFSQSWPIAKWNGIRRRKMIVERSTLDESAMRNCERERILSLFWKRSGFQRVQMCNLVKMKKIMKITNHESYIAERVRELRRIMQF